jgi:hypothetical protein
MSDFEHDELPPDLSELGRRMRRERPVADDDGLDRMMQRARTPPRSAPRRTPRRVFAVSLATMLAMVSVTGVAAAALFGMNLPLLGNSLTNSSQRVGAASSQVLRAPAASSSSSSRLPATIGSAVGAIGNVAGVGSSRAGGTSRAAALPAGFTATARPNAANFQYNARQLVCRILRALGLNRIARLLGCS